MITQEIEKKEVEAALQTAKEELSNLETQIESTKQLAQNEVTFPFIEAIPPASRNEQQYIPELPEKNTSLAEND